MKLEHTQEQAQSEIPTAVEQVERPNFNDILDHSEAGFVKRSVAKYLFTKNPDRSVKFYEYLGMPLFRRFVMGTAGRMAPPGTNVHNTYRTDKSKSMIERSTSFAVGGSVVNEALHTPFFLYHGSNLIEGQSPVVNGIAFGVQSALIGLQRYNRARMIQRVNEELADGQTYDYAYTNWLGVDGLAVARYEDNNHIDIVKKES